MKLKKLIALSLCLVMLFSLAACSSNKDDEIIEDEEVSEDIGAGTDDIIENEDEIIEEDIELEDETDDTDVEVETPAESTVAPVVPETTPDVTPDTTPEVVEPSEPETGDENSDAETFPEDSTDDTASSSVLATFMETVMSTYEFSVMGDFDAELLEGFYPGIGAISTVTAIGKMSMISASSHEIVLVECENADDVASVIAIMEARKTSQAEGGAWYPENIEQWTNAQIVSNGNYVMLIVHPDSDAIATSFNAL